jgi:hypothetical protein
MADQPCMSAQEEPALARFHVERASRLKAGVYVKVICRLRLLFHKLAGLVWNPSIFSRHRSRQAAFLLFKARAGALGSRNLLDH